VVAHLLSSCHQLLLSVKLCVHIHVASKSPAPVAPEMLPAAAAAGGRAESSSAKRRWVRRQGRCEEVS
jgi:hypothetical protein